MSLPYQHLTENHSQIKLKTGYDRRESTQNSKKYAHLNLLFPHLSQYQVDPQQCNPL